MLELAHEYCTHKNSLSSLQLIVSVFLWIFGVFCNLFNIIVFSNQQMKSPVNFLFKWLAVSDLIELILIVVVDAFYCGWCTELPLFNAGFTTEQFELYGTRIRAWGLVLGSFLLLIFHSVTIFLNIALALSRYFAISYPLRSEIQLRNRSAKLTVVAAFLLSLGLSSVVVSNFTMDEDKQKGLSVSPKRIHNPSYSTLYMISFTVLRVGLLIALIIISIM